jgi:hypothetical protein
MILSKLVKNEKDLLCDASLLDILTIVKEAHSKRPSSKTEKMISNMMNIVYYINDLRMERHVYDDTLNRCNLERLKALEKVKEMQKEFYNYDNTTQRGGLE